jgi:hemoglobin
MAAQFPLTHHFRSTPHIFFLWLQLFRQTAQEVCTPEGAAHVVLRAERIARSLHIAVAEAKAAPDAVPSLY